MPRRRRVLVLIQGTLGEDLIGPEIRGWEMVRALSATHSVTAAATVPAPTSREGVSVVPRTRRSILAQLREHDAIIGPVIPPYALAGGHRCLRVSDLYDPVDLELGTLEGRRAEREIGSQQALRRLQLRWSDLVLCANERQREAIEAELGRVRRDGAVPEVVTVPMGLPPAPPPASGHPLRDRFPQIGVDDPLVLWWGSVWRWLDAGTVVEAIGELSSRRPDVRLVITAGRPANAATDPLNVTEEVRELARARGLLGRHVFFLDDWVPFAERDRYLADADLGITLHADTAEATVAARSRYMDCIWASLPTVLAEGDEVADRLAAAGAAVLVPSRDATATAAALEALLADPRRLEAARAACSTVAAEFQWPALMSPLADRLATAEPPARDVGQRLRVAAEAGGYYARRAVDRALRAS
jgi:glycosyltransferase involved in cell wall biosynthesis